MLPASPANIIRQFLIEEGIGQSHSKKDWVVYTASEPDDPDNAITIYNTRGTLDGRIHETGEVVQHYGFQTKIRGKDDETASAKGREIYTAYNQLLRRLITVNSVAIRLQAITLKSPLMPMGQQVKGRRILYVVNAIVTIDEEF